MQFQFFFKQMESSEALREHTENKLTDIVQRFATKPIEAHITFLVDRHTHTARCVFSGGDGFNLQVEHSSDDMYASVDQLALKFEAQMKKRKEKMTDHKGHANVRKLAVSSNREQEAIDAAEILKFEAARKKQSAR